MIDLTAKLSEPIPKNFFENVLNKDSSDTIQEKIDEIMGNENLSDDERLEMLIELGLTPDEIVDIMGLGELAEEYEDANIVDLNDYSGSNKDSEDSDPNVVSFDRAGSSTSSSEADADKTYLEKDEYGKYKELGCEKGDTFEKIAVAIPYSAKYMMSSMKYRTLGDIKPFLNTMTKISFMSSVIFGGLWLLGFNFIFDLKAAALTSIACVVVSKLGVLQSNSELSDEEIEELNKQESKDIWDLYQEEEAEQEDDLDGNNSAVTDVEEVEVEEEEEKEGISEEDRIKEAYNRFGFSLPSEDDEDEEDDEDGYYEEDIEDYNEEDDITDNYEYDSDKKKFFDNYPIPLKIVDEDITNEEFDAMMYEAIRKSEKLRNKNLIYRDEIFESFQEFILSNNPDFSNFTNVKEGSNVYNNLAYLIYKSVKDTKKWVMSKKERDSKSKIVTMKINSFTENTLMYRVEVLFSETVSLAEVLGSPMNRLYSSLKATDDDDEISVQVSAFGSLLVYKVAKGKPALVTLGDMLRYYDKNKSLKDQAYNVLMDRNLDYGVAIGLKNSEYPTIIDMDGNTSMMINGTSGSGKSWASYSVVYNTVLQNHPGDVVFVVGDFKSDPQYTFLSELPHVLTLTNSPNEILEMVDRVNNLVMNRTEIFNKTGIVKLSEFRLECKRRGDIELLRSMPWVVVIIEEMGSLMNSLMAMDRKGEVKRQFEDTLSNISRLGRSVGVKVIAMSQRCTSAEIPFSISANCSIKLAMKQKKTDLEKIDMYDPEVPPAEKLGFGLFMDEVGGGPHLVRTLGLGGRKPDHVSSFMRAVAAEWHLRLDDSFFDKCPLEGLEEFDTRKEKRERILKQYNDGTLFDAASALSEGNIDKTRDILLKGLSSGVGVIKEESKVGKTVKEEKVDRQGKTVRKVKTIDKVVKQDLSRVKAEPFEMMGNGSKRRDEKELTVKDYFEQYKNKTSNEIIEIETRESTAIEERIVEEKKKAKKPVRGSKTQIMMYIEEFSKDGSKKIPVEELQSMFDEEDIAKEIEVTNIVEKDGYYYTQ